jgi:protein ImuB
MVGLVPKLVWRMKLVAGLRPGEVTATEVARSERDEQDQPGEEAAAVTPLPLGTLRLSNVCLAGLHRLGLHRIGNVLRQPRAPLTRRFGRPP